MKSRIYILLIIALASASVHARQGDKANAESKTVKAAPIQKRPPGDRESEISDSTKRIRAIQAPTDKESMTIKK